MQPSIYIIGSISEETFKAVVEFLDENKDMPVLVEINSEGGSGTDGMAIHSRLRGHGGKVTTRAVGLCGSAAVSVFLAGDVREAYEETWFMVHNGGIKVNGSTTEVVAETKYLIAQDKQFCKLLADKTGIAGHYWKRACSKTTYFTATEALNLRLVQKVL